MPHTHIVPPPLRIVFKGWWTYRELSMTEAEAYHRRKAAEGGPDAEFHLREAEANRVWANRVWAKRAP